MDSLMRLFRERLLARLVDKDAISRELAKRLMSWPHPGLSAHVGELIAADDTQVLERRVKGGADAPRAKGSPTYAAWIGSRRRDASPASRSRSRPTSWR
jgi:hypothetical protein